MKLKRDKEFGEELTCRFKIALMKKLTDINRCLTDPANRCLTDINRYYISYSTYPVLVILNR